jgi:phenylalanyl-tRNA synthetase alpha chain
MSESTPTADLIAEQILAFERALKEAASLHEAKLVRDRFLGRNNSVLSTLMQQIAAAPPEVRGKVGRYANEFKKIAESKWAEFQAEAVVRGLAATTEPAVDVSLPGRGAALGRRHPLTIVRDELEAIFGRMGFAVVEGPEAEDEWHCFDALNMPAEHPARDMQDTLYLAQPIKGDTARADDVRTLLRTHTSSMQIRYMQAHQPPIRIVAPGRVYRRDDLDVTHSPAFSQIEALVVDEGISMAHLKGTLLAFVREMFSSTSRVRFRPSFFPYTEPSAEIDISCWQCDGAGCQMCKRTGWIEMGGCGMVHPAVFEAVGYDPEKYTGFAWGIGIERVAILRYQVEDIRLFYENDLRFLEQFPY